MGDVMALPKPLSYAQNLEDYHLWLALGGEGIGAYIDIGAGHPVADNVSMWFYERGWSGIAVEPQSELAALYPLLRPRDKIVSALIGGKSGDAPFHKVDRLHGFSTTLQAFAEGAAAFGAGYETQTLPMLTLAQLCEREQVETIDFLKIDVEGGEADVLAGNDWARFRPKVIVAEAIAPGSNSESYQAWEPYLLAQGYRFALFDTLNRFYVAQEQTAVWERFPKARADWAVATHLYEIGRAPETATHPDHALALELARGLWASLPALDQATLAALLAKARAIAPDSQAFAALLREVGTQAFKIRLGRIAGGYDGGQIWE
jgi:FkbM family methyltransferase